MAGEDVEIRLTVSGRPEAVRGFLDVGRAAQDSGRKASLASRGFSSMSRGIGGVAKLAGKALVGGLAAGGLAIAGFTAWVAKGSQSLMRIEKIGAQTNAVIESTGGVANVTRAGIDDYAGSLEALTGIEAESITEGQNMLLTFTNIRNEAGKNNKVFDQATSTLVDMSTALGTDAKKSAVQLGKALNDPIKGITALSKVGVSFTEQQRDQIKALVEGGDTMGAQKIILAELNKEFGGSAEAFGATTAGKIERFKHSVGTLQETLAGAFAPTLAGIATFLVNKGVPATEAWGEAFNTSVVPRIKETIALGKRLAGAYQTGGLDGVVDVIEKRFGVDLTSVLEKAEDIFDRVSTVILDGVVPAVVSLATGGAGVASVLNGWLSPLGMADNLLTFLADHTGLVSAAIVTYVTALTLAKIATLAHAAVTATMGALMVARVGIHALLTGSILTNTGAELTRNQALAASIALHLRIGAAMLASAAKTAVHTAATVASTVASKVARGAVLAWAAGQWILNAAMAANPIGLVVIAIVALVAGLVLAYKKSDTFRAIVDKLWQVTKAAFAGMLSAAKSFFAAALPAFQKIIAVIGRVIGFVVRLAVAWVKFQVRVVTAVAQFVVKVVTFWVKLQIRIVKTVASLVMKVVKFFTSIPGRVGSALAKIGGIAASAFDKVRSWAVAKATAAVKAYVGLPGKIGAKIGDLGKHAATWFGKIVTAAAKIPGKIVDLFRGLGSKVLSAIGNIDLGSLLKIPDAGGGVPFIPGLAKGGPVTANRPYIVGEKRPELFVPRVDGMIIPRVPDMPDFDDLDVQVGSGGGGEPIVVQLVLDGKVISETVLSNLETRAARR